MQFIDNSFTDKVRKGKIKSPLRPDFSIQKWNDAQRETEFDNRLHQAGLFFHKQFSAIRTELKNIEKLSIPLSEKDHLEIFAGLANRESKVILDKLEDQLSKQNPILILDFNTLKNDNNFLKNKYTFNEISTSTVDGIYYNIASHFKEKEKPLNHLFKKEEILRLLRIENLLSQLYYSYEQYWNSILYQKLNFHLKNNEILLKDNTILMESFLITDTRKSNIKINETLVIHDFMKKRLNDYAYLTYKDGAVWITEFSKLKDEHQNQIIACFSSFSDETIDFIPNELISYSFKINEIISTFVNLSSLAYSFITNNTISTDIKPSEYFNLKKFNPIINVEELCKCLFLITGIEYNKINQIIDFLTFSPDKSSGPRSDLWRFPLLKINNDECLIVLEPTLHPVGLRCFEGWMAKANVDIQKKGTAYEKHIKTSLNSYLEKNKFINEYNILDIDTISIGSEKEEIDLLLKIGNLVILGEAKCAVTTDSPISVWNSVETIKHASEQSLRKISFVQNNFEAICKRFDWHYDENLNYSFSPIVILSNGFSSGYSFFNVPVVDHYILFSYFQTEKFPLISKNTEEHLAYLNLYSSSMELSNNFQKFAKKPPSIECYKLWITTLEPIKIMSCKDNFNPIIKHYRLGMKSTSYQEILNHDYGFEIVISDDCYEYLES